MVVTNTPDKAVKNKNVDPMDLTVNTTDQAHLIPN